MGDAGTDGSETLGEGIESFDRTLIRKNLKLAVDGTREDVANGTPSDPASAPHSASFSISGSVVISAIREDDDIFSWLERVNGGYDIGKYRQVLGAANAFKEGDAAEGLAAADEQSRANARRLLSNTTIGALLDHPVFPDEVVAFADRAVDASARRLIEPWTVERLVRFLLDSPEPAIKAVMAGLTSDVIACAVKVMSNHELIAVAQKVFNPLPGSNIGAKGYMGARIQPNSPTDDPEDILMQVLDGWSYAVGDVVLGTNPVSGDVDQVARVESALQDLIVTFGLEDVIPHCVLAHIDVQAEVERRFPRSTAIWFQSLAGVADANRVFDIHVEKLIAHARTRTGRFGLYFETGQGADGTNGHGKGFDMVIHESRKYGLARALKAVVAGARAEAGNPGEPWVHVNDVAGFIGPEVFRTKAQLVRVCLEDTVMGKLHGLAIGLDICSTLHMEITIDDLDECVDQIMPANPAYLMALPTKNDPMLSYLTTAFQDHVRIREKFGYKVNDRMWAFFQKLGVIDTAGRPTAHFGDPRRVYLVYRRARGDARLDSEVLGEADERLARVRGRGVFVANGYGARPWELAPGLDREVRHLYEDAKSCIRCELPAALPSVLTPAIRLTTQSRDRDDYIRHPPTGEVLDEGSRTRVRQLDDARGGRYEVQIVVSDGLNACALIDDGHVAPYLDELRRGLAAAGFQIAPDTIVVTSGRVRVGYRIGEVLFGGLAPSRSAAVVHLIGERPGNGHHTFSAYITKLPAHTWAQRGIVDHNHTKVVSNIADTAFDPILAAGETVALLQAVTTGAG